MSKWIHTVILILFALLTGCSGPGEHAPPPRSDKYDDLVTLFGDWREFQKPPLSERVPDYSTSSMATQHRQLADYQGRLKAIDPSGWTISEKVDFELVRAEMNGLDFDHRVLRPWARNPAFYVMVFPSQTDVPAREGPVVEGAIELWEYAFPLSPEKSIELGEKLKTIPPLLHQARTHLVENARDLWLAGVQSMKAQSADLATLAETTTESNPELLPLVEDAREATDDFVAWLEQGASSKTGPSGVGVANYDWYLNNVHLLAYTWADEVALMRRELARAHAFLKLEEHRNRRLPPLEPVASQEEHEQRFNAAVAEYMDFLTDEEIVSVREFMDAALRARIGRYRPPDRPWEFFTQVDYRDPVVMRTHGYHWFDLARMAQEPHPSPIRRTPLLYNIFDARAEGLATGMEEMMMQAGLFDSRPRARELIYVLLAQRAARALGDLFMHANQFTLEEAAKFAVEWTPRGWLREDGTTVWGEQHLYLQQPAYGTSYLIGKIEVEKLLMERSHQLGAEFSLRRFMDELDSAGVIPVSLIRWEITGLGDEISRLTDSQER